MAGDEVTGLIPDDIVERVRSATDIVELVSEYVALKKSGANYMGLCPFHNEKTPSFTVSPSKQIYHCFGCGAGGDAVGFLVKHDNYTFPEAVRRLAERAGIEVPETGRAGVPKRDLEPVYGANEAAAGFFASCLWDASEGKAAREYLERRGIPEGLSREFSFGYSLSAWDGLLKHLEKKGIGPDVAEKAGLALKKTSGKGWYDRFRERVMFPIRDVKGRVVGFGGRTMGDGEPKYLNSPETPAFRKGETLYLLDAAGEHIRKRGYAVVVEGYFDAVACHRAGVKNAVATLGTALTPSHLRLLGRYSKNVLLVFDADEAGMKAAQRSLDVFQPTTMTAKVAMLPPGDDPDSLVGREGAAGLAERLKDSGKLIDFVIGRLAKKAGTIEEKVEAASGITRVLAGIRNAVERSHYLKLSAALLGVDEPALAEELGKSLSKSVLRAGMLKKGAAPSSRIQEELLHLALRYPEVALEMKTGLGPEDFTDPALTGIARLVMEHVAEDGTVQIPALLDSIEDEQEKKLLEELCIKDTRYEDPSASARGGIARLVEGRDKRALAGLVARIKQAEQTKDVELLNKLQKEFVEWQKKKSWKK